MLRESAKVVVNEIDLSTSIEAASTLSVGMVGRARRGKAFERMLISNDRQCLDKLGEPKEGYYLVYGALDYLTYGKQAWCVRVVPEDAKCAVLMADKDGVVKNIPSIKNYNKVELLDDEEVYQVTSSSDYFELDFSQLYTYFTPGSIKLTISGSTTIQFIDDGSGLIEDANGNILAINYLDGKMIVKTVNPLQAGDVFTITATYSDFNHFSEYLAGNYSIIGQGNGGTSYTFDIEDKLVEGSVKITFGSNELLDDGQGNLTGTGGSGTVSYSDGIINITTSSAVASGTNFYCSRVYQRLQETLAHFAITGPGDYGSTEFNLLVVNKSDYPNSGFYFNDYPRKNNEFLILLKNMLTRTIDEQYVVSRDKNAKNVDGTSRFANDIFASPNHLYCTVNSDQDTQNQEIGTFRDINGDLTYEYFVNGEDGILPITDSDYIRGFELYRDKQQISVSIIPSLGITSPSVLNRIIDIVENRRSVGLLDSPFVVDSVEDAVKWRRGEFPGMIGFNPNTSFAGAYPGWRKIKDFYNDKEVWIPMTASILANYAKAFYFGQPWDAVAGNKRGVINNTLELQFNPKEGDRDYMYANQLNPVFSAPGKGTRIWGDKTLQSYYSALSFLPTRFLLNILTEALGNYAETTLWERNTPSLRSKVRADIEAYLGYIYRQEGIEAEFKVICDESNNTGYILDQRGLVIDVYIIPTSTIEVVLLNVVIMNHVAKFEEVIMRKSQMTNY